MGKKTSQKTSSSLILKYEYDFMEAKITQQTSAEDAYRKFEDMGLKQIESLRKLTKDVNQKFF